MPQHWGLILSAFLPFNSATPITTPEELNSVTPSLTNYPLTLKATLTGSNENTNTETLSPFFLSLLDINSCKNNILKVQLLALKSSANCKLLILRNQIEPFTKHTKILLGHEHRNIDALRKNIAFLQKELTEKNKIIKSLMETQTAVPDVMTDLRQQPNTPEQNIAEYLFQNNMFNQRYHNYRNKDHSREKLRKRKEQVAKENKIICKENFHETVKESDLWKRFGLRTTNYIIDNYSIELPRLQWNRKHNGHAFFLAPFHACDELVKLHGLEFHSGKIIIEEAKTPPRTFVNKLSTNAATND